MLNKQNLINNMAFVLNEKIKLRETGREGGERLKEGGKGNTIIESRMDTCLQFVDPLAFFLQ